MLRLPGRLINGNVTRVISNKNIRAASTTAMATASSVHLGPGIEPQYPRSAGGDDAPPESSSQKASALLQQNHDSFHIFFNDMGFHNHISHQLLSLWALNATPAQLQRQFDLNKGMQRPAGRPDPSAVDSLRDPAFFLSHLGPRSHYQDFLAFFTSEIEARGWQETLRRYVFARGDARAEAMFVRLHAGILHPVIHIGFGVEFEQPAILAEGLAETACHDAWLGELLGPAEELAAGKAGEPEKFADLLDEARRDGKLAHSATWADENKIRDGIMERAKGEMVALAARVRVGKDAGLDEAVAEMTDAVAYYTAGAQRRDKMVKFDFFFIHCLNSTIFYPAFMRQEWLSREEKVRLVEWKARMDLIMYVSRNSPEILVEEIKGYKPKRPSGWEGVEKRVCAMDDDGHSVKLVRALANGQEICKPFEGKKGFRLTGDDWLRLGHMAIDSVEGPGQTWVRSAGWEEAWQDIPAKL